MTVKEPNEEYDLIVFHETEKAFQVGKVKEDIKKKIWIPKSQIEVGERKGNEGNYEIYRFTIPDWLAERAELS